MSGIAGIVGSGTLDEVRRMLARMSYRGPEQRAWSPVPGVYLGEVGHRTGTDSHDTVAVTAPVSRLVGADVPRTVLGAQLSLDLAGTLQSLQGDFAIAAIRPAARYPVVLAVDQMAARSLYVLRLATRWVFATEYKALLALTDCPAAVDRDALQYFVRYGRCPADRSLLWGAKRVTRGVAMHLSAERAVLQPYVDKNVFENVGTRPHSIREVRKTLESIVDRKLNGSDRVALTLSAGLDSTLLLAMVKHVRPEIEVATYTVGHGRDDPEILGARRTADHFGTEHHECFVDDSDILDTLPENLWMSENPSGQGASIMQHRLMRTVAEREKLVIAGHAADMVFCGMPRHRALWIADRSPEPVRTAVRELFVYTQIRKVPDSWLGRMLVQLSQGEEPSEGVRILDARTPEWPRRLTTLDGYRAEYWSSDSLRYGKSAADAAGLKALSPFAEPELRDIALGLPASSLIGFRQQKRILRQAMADLLPKAFVMRPKAIQKLDTDDRLSKTLQGLAARLQLDASLTRRSVIERGAADHVISRLRSRTSASTLSDLWGLIATELWMQCFVDARGAAPPRLQ